MEGCWDGLGDGEVRAMGGGSRVGMSGENILGTRRWG